MHESLFDAAPFNHDIVEKDYVGVRNIYWLGSSTVFQNDILRRVPFHYDEWFWPPVTVERKGNMLSTTLCPWTWSVWPRHAAVGRHYAQCRKALHIFERGKVSLKRYCREIILDHICLFRYAISPDCLFMDNNARPHRNAQTSNTLESEDINYMIWLAYFLDINFIQNICNALCRSVSQITRPLRTVQDLNIVLSRVWDYAPLRTSR